MFMTLNRRYESSSESLDGRTIEDLTVGGGAVPMPSSSGASDQASRQNAQTNASGQAIASMAQMGMMLAQTNLLNAQAKTEANRPENVAADTANTQADTK